jgi:hypothetical protein
MTEVDFPPNLGPAETIGLAMAAAYTAASKAMLDIWLAVDVGVVPPLRSDGVCEAKLHVTTSAITAAIPILTRVTGDDEVSFILPRGMALEALRLVRWETGTTCPALPE